MTSIRDLHVLDINDRPEDEFASGVGLARYFEVTRINSWTLVQRALATDEDISPDLILTDVSFDRDTSVQRAIIQGSTDVDAAIQQAIVDKVPPPKGDPNAPTKGLLVDAWYDNYLGVVVLVRLLDGSLTRGSLFVEGQIARFMYWSLHKQHQLALSGWWSTLLGTLAEWLHSVNRPRIKLH